MGDSLANAAGSDMVVTLKGKLYTLSPLSVKDFAAFEAYIKSQNLQRFMAASEGMDEPTRVRTIAEMAGGGFSSIDILAEATTMSGVQFLLHRALMKSQPELDMDQVGELVDLTNLDEVSAVLGGLGGTVNPPPPAEAGRG